MDEDTYELGDSVPPPRRGPGVFLRLWNAIVRLWNDVGDGGKGGLPSSIGRYRVLRKIGEGGMGTVFEAIDESLGRRVAIKRIKNVDEAAKRRFRREARAVACISHPNVCQLFEFGQDESGLFLAMELLAGEPLSARLRRGPMPPTDALSLGAGILAALSAVHDAGLVHRDLKPSNVYLTPFGPRLLDFGLARALPVDLSSAASEVATPAPMSGSEITSARIVIGTPGYMSPEQIRDEDVDARSDLFAAAAVLYEALTGRRAFPGATVVEAWSASLLDSPAPLEPALARLDAVLRRALAKKKEHRFATAQEMAEALHRASTAPAASAEDSLDLDAGEIFVGRADELGWLDERLESALEGRGGVVFVTGERGAGKSALVGEMLRRARASSRPITIVAGRCLEHQGPRDPLQPFLDALGRLFGTSRGRDQAVELVKTWAPTVGVLMPPALVPDPDGSLRRQTAGATRERLIREAGDFMEAATRIYPVVLLLEDLQWADPVSVDVLCHLGRRAARQRILFLCTCRSSEVESTNAPLHRGMLDLRTAGQGHELELGPLSAREVERWVDRRFPNNDFAGALAPVVHGHAEGLPLYVRSLFELLAGRRDIEPSASGFQLARPLETLDLEPSKDVKDLVRAHLGTLPAPERELLAAASVLGKEFSSAIARGLASGDELALEERLQTLCRVHRVLESRGEDELPDGALGTRYRFAHGLYQRVLYEDLVAPRRADLHRRAGELLLRHWGETAPSRAVEMAEHFERGRDVARAVRFRTLAGEHAARRFAGLEAVAHYTAALMLLHKQPTDELRSLEAGLYGRRARARLLLAEFDEAARDYQAMLERAREARLPAAACDALSGLCNAHFFEQRQLEMSAQAREAVRAAERLGSPHHLAEARGREAQALVMEGHLKKACRSLDSVLSEARASGSQAALQLGLVYRGFVHYWQCEFEACETLMAEALLVCEERGDGFEALAVRMFLALARANLGRMSEGLIDLQQAEVFAARNGDRFWHPRLVSFQGWILRELADLEQARELHARALAVARANPSPWTPEIDVLLHLCVDGVQSGDPEGAQDVLAILDDRSRRPDWFRWMNDLRLEAAAAEHYAARRELAATAQRTARLRAVATRIGARNYRCAAARMDAEIALAGHGSPAEALARLEHALALFGDVRAPLETWRSRRVLGLVQLRLGSPRAARAAFEAAAADIETILRGTDQPALRASFLCSAPVREVLVQAGRA